jgi:hypothetical protein
MYQLQVNGDLSLHILTLLATAGTSLDCMPALTNESTLSLNHGEIIMIFFAYLTTMFETVSNFKALRTDEMQTMWT